VRDNTTGSVRRAFTAGAGARTGVCRAAVAVAALLAPAALRGQAPARADTGVAACVARDTATAWKQVAARWSADSDSAAGWSDDSLRRVLLALGRRDQAVRDAPDLADSVLSAAFRARMARTDSADAAELQGIIARFGWPTRSMVGVAGAEAAFLVAQHNRGLHLEALALMRALPAGQYSPGEYAMLEDRVLVAEGRPQRYGTQLTVAGSGPLRFDSIADLAHLAGLRAAAGLPPLGVYMCIIRSAYGRPVVDPRAATAAAPR
jgi:hypothetical protein